MMSRSRMARDVRLILLAAIGLMLAGCEDAPPSGAVFFKDGPGCLARFESPVCIRAQDAAFRDYQANAPVWNTREECETEFGRDNCSPRYMPSNRPYYAPAMMGFLSDGDAFAAPVYAEADGTALVLRGARVFRVGKFVLPPPVVAGQGRERLIVKPASPAYYTDFLGMTPEEVPPKSWSVR